MDREDFSTLSLAAVMASWGYFYHTIIIGLIIIIIVMEEVGVPGEGKMNPGGKEKNARKFHHARSAESDHGKTGFTLQEGTCGGSVSIAR